MAREIDTSRTDEIARVAYAIWEDEGRPDGRDHEHWTKAQRLIEEGRTYTEFPAAAAGDAGGEPNASVSASDEAARSRRRASAKQKPEEDHTFVRPAGRKLMENPPSSWSKTDEEVDESFPASDPPGNY